MLITKFRIFENVQQAKSILKSLNIDEKDKDYTKIKSWLAGHEGYIGWFTKMRYKDKVGMNSLSGIAGLIKNNPTLVRSLPKNLIQYDSLESLQDDIEITKTKMEVKKCYDEFPSAQKKLLKIEDPKIQTLLKSLWGLKNREHYFAKVARYKTGHILIDSIKSFIEGNSKTDGYDSILRRIGNGSGLTKMVTDPKNEIIIIRAIDPSVVSSLGRGTSWCIRDADTFRSYVPDNTYRQYMIWLTDMPTWSEYSIIGLTIGPNGYRTAHKKNDSHIGVQELMELLASRNVDIKKLYPNQEKSYNYTVPELRHIFGLSDDDILDNKKMSLQDTTFFKKDQLDKHGVTAQFGLTIKQLVDMEYSKDDIMKHKQNFTVYDIPDLTDDEIRKIGFDKFHIQDILKRFDVKEVLGGRTFINRHEFYAIKPEDIIKYDLMVDDVDLSTMIERDNSRRSSEEYKFVIPLEYILSHKSKWSSSDLSCLTKKCALDLIKKYKISGCLNNFVSGDTLSKQEVIDNAKNITLDPTYLGHVGLTIDDCSKYNINVIFGSLPNKKPSFSKDSWREGQSFYES